ncbi:unnamed protein product [Anisakis simplex]|uniref:Secreted protein n=1 Tax=Anisakis simplex TaxID=6269 RepID=A0A0M3JBJ5_ANISI|nr:unnamed protein product [Anisakis simplex]
MGLVWRPVLGCPSITAYSLSSHSANGAIIIIKVQVIKAGDCKRPAVKQFHNSKIHFPLPHRVTKRRNAAVFTTRRPRTHFA